MEPISAALETFTLEIMTLTTEDHPSTVNADLSFPATKRIPGPNLVIAVRLVGIVAAQRITAVPLIVTLGRV
jgi:hypothetical protein